eukprot:615216-Pleurochrysis_carterae.AAC.1
MQVCSAVFSVCLIAGMTSVEFEDSFKCVCGTAFKSFRGLENYMARFCGKVDDARAETFTVEADRLNASKRASEAQQNFGKRARVYPMLIRCAIGLQWIWLTCVT